MKFCNLLSFFFPLIFNGVFVETDDTNLKIADFGFAKRVSDLSAKETACGTPGYVAPEILRCDKYGTEVDVWSMGVICYVLLAGYPPFYDEDQKKLFRKIKEGRYHFHEDYWCNTSPEAIDMIQCMLCVDQKKRWTCEQLLKHPWITMGEEQLAVKELGSAIVVMKKFNARRRLRAAADAVILANRMKNMFGKLKKLKSLIDEEALLDAQQTSDGDLNHSDSKGGISDSDVLGDDVPSSHPAQDLLNDGELQ